MSVMRVRLRFESRATAIRTAVYVRGNWRGGIRRLRATSNASRSAQEAKPTRQRANGCERSWLGGRDSNPDTVVQRAVHRFRSASIRFVAFGFSPSTSAPFRSVSLCSCAVCLSVSRPHRPSAAASCSVLRSTLCPGRANPERRPLRLRVE